MVQGISENIEGHLDEDLVLPGHQYQEVAEELMKSTDRDIKKLLVSTPEPDEFPSEVAHYVAEELVGMPTADDCAAKKISSGIFKIAKELRSKTASMW